MEIVCSDLAEHRRRVESRQTDIDGLKLPTWDDVVSRDFRAWDTERLVIDTARETVEEAVAEILAVVSRGPQTG